MISRPSSSGPGSPGEGSAWGGAELRFREDLGGWPGVLGRLSARQDLSAGEAACVLEEVLSGTATPAQIAAMLIALRMKGETVEEMTGFVRAMLEHAERLDLGDLATGSGNSGNSGNSGGSGNSGNSGGSGGHGPMIDTCGTGGDRSGSINVSTISALVVAGAGVPVCKHGGRAASSSAGSADVLEALGVVVDLAPAGVATCIAEAGIGFCFAPRFHPAMRHAAPVRRDLGVPTVFNFLGPLANPARVPRQLIGVSDPAMAPKMLGVLRANGSERAMVVYGEDGLDEISTTGPTNVEELTAEGELRTYVFDVAELGIARARPDDLRGGDVSFNAEVVRRVLGGEAGPYRDIVVANSAASLLVAGAAGDMAEGLERSNEALDSGAAARALELLVEASQGSREAGN